MINLAIDLAERQLREGTASAQVISHYLKLASSRDKLEKEYLAKKTQLLDVQIDSAQTYKDLETMFREAMDAYSSYSVSAKDESEEGNYD